MYLMTAAMIVFLAGCNSGKKTRVVNAESIDAASFRDPDAPAAQARPVVVRTDTADHDESRNAVVALVGGPDEVEMARTAEGESETKPGSRPRVRTSDARLIVDQMVGQINGQPLYASDFFRDMDARLAASTETMGTREWLAFAQTEIRRTLQVRLREDLLLAEFQSALSLEERAGLLGFLQTVREQYLRNNLGSEALADDHFRRTEGISLDEKIEQTKEREFIREQVRREVESRVHVSYRDIKKRYERDRASYETESTAHFRVIRIRTEDETTKAAVLEAFANGTPPVEIAAEYGRFNTSEDGLHRVVLEEDDVATQKIFDPPELNDPARSLRIGETAGPIEYRSGTWWICFESVDRPEATSLYDVQLKIERELRYEYGREEEHRYLAELLSRSSYSSFEAMADRLIKFAAERYLILPNIQEELDRLSVQEN